MQQQNFSAKKLNDQQLLQGLDKLVKSERKLMHIILAYIHEVEVRKLHLDLGYDSIFKFLTKHHGYSEDAAYARMHGARLLAQIPALKDKLEEGSISLTQISKVCSAIRAEKISGKAVSHQQTQDLLEKIQNQNLQETRKTIAIELDQPVVQLQSVKPQKDESFLIQATLSQVQYEAFQKAQNYISHSVPNASIADALEYLSKALIKKIEGNRCAAGDHEVNSIEQYRDRDKRVDGNTENGNSNDNGKKCSQKETTHKTNFCGGNPDRRNNFETQNQSSNDVEINPLSEEKTVSLKRKKVSMSLGHPGNTPASASSATQSFRVIRRRKYISRKIRRQLLAECNGHCSFEHPETGIICDSLYQLQADHIVPVSEGGSDDISNLRIMCGIHNRDRNRIRRWKARFVFTERSEVR